MAVTPQFLFILCSVFGRCTVKDRSTAMSCIFPTLRILLFPKNLIDRATSGMHVFLSLSLFITANHNAIITAYRDTVGISDK